MYFLLAASWGFLSGSAAVVGAMSMLGRPVRFEAGSAAVLLGAALVALVGGGVSAYAYRETSGKLGR